VLRITHDRQLPPSGDGADRAPRMLAGSPRRGWRGRSWAPFPATLQDLRLLLPSCMFALSPHSPSRIILSPHNSISQKDAAPWVRVLVLLLAVVAVATMSYYETGSALPSDPKDSFLFQSALLLIVLGTALVEYKFTKPADAAVNALSGIVTLLGIYYLAPTAAWWVVFAYCTIVFVAAILCVAVSSSTDISGWQAKVARWTYRPAIVFGRAQLLFSLLFLFGLFSFRQLQSPQTVELVLFWGLFLVLWPLGIPSLLTAIARRERTRLRCLGQLVRTDWPDIVRVALGSGTTWDHEHPVIIQHVGDLQCVVVPLYSQPQDGQNLGTGICLRGSTTSFAGLAAGAVYELPPEDTVDSADVFAALGIGSGERLLGFIVEDSKIATIRFETWDPQACREGMLVFAMVDSQRVFYQVIDGTTKEEVLQAGRHGFQVATAAQVGVLKPGTGFVKFSWLPPMNAPVFAFPSGAGEGLVARDKHDFEYGLLPTTQIPVVGDLLGAIDHHTAILGVTGSGKTELALEMIRHAVHNGVRVVCIDLTARYAARLVDLTPKNLSLDPDISAKLGKLMFEAETGAYGAGTEKKALKSFSDPLRKSVRQALESFTASTGEDGRVGIITLDEISNTKATLAITEMFLSCLLESARARTKASEQVLVVLEEAHTIVPEASTMGLGDYDSRGMVAKIAQIALQGRKYGIGLLVVAQRTATVSKSILTQCNTVVSFSCIDDTSLNFLANVFGEQHTALLPNLRSLQAVGFGKGVRSERPILFEIPYSDAKKRAADRADGRIAGHGSAAPSLDTPPYSPVAELDGSGLAADPARRLSSDNLADK